MSLLTEPLPPCTTTSTSACSGPPVDHTEDGTGKDSLPDFVTVGTETPAPEVIETPTPEPLPPCPTEDSEGCYWDSDTMGNGQGDDVVTTPEYPTEGMPEDFDPDTDSTAPIPGDPGEGAPRQDYDTGILDCGVNAAPYVDQDPWGNWWAYCEPALINEDGSHWEGVTP